MQIVISFNAITNPTRFNPAIGSWILNQKGYRKFKNNPTQADRDTWGYAPKLTITQRGLELILTLEFSAQKIFFQSEDNVNEIDESNFEAIVSRIKTVVGGMGVRLYAEQIRQAEVLGFHPAKNILLSNYYSALLAISELRKSDTSKKIDVDCKQWRNGGEVLQFYTNLHSLAIYDKMRDIKKPPKRAFDKDRTSRQQYLFDNLSKSIEILRMEARLRKKYFEEIFKEIGYYNYSPTFRDIFNKDLCQKILQRNWEYHFHDKLFIFDSRNEHQRLLQLVMKRYEGKKMDLYKPFGIAFFILCARDEAGMAGIRNIVEFYKPKNNWSKTKKWLDGFKKSLEKDRPYLHGFVKDIERQLEDFEPVKIGRMG